MRTYAIAAHWPGECGFAPPLELFTVEAKSASQAIVEAKRVLRADYLPGGKVWGCEDVDQ